MPIVIVTHPHSFDSGLLKKDIPRFVNKVKLPTYFIPDGNREPYGGKKIYSGVFPPERDKPLGEVGRASLTDEDADDVVKNENVIFLAGGNLDECVASTYNSIVRAAERLYEEKIKRGEKYEPRKIILVEDLIYLQVKKNGSVATLQDLRAKNGPYQKYVQMFEESEKVKRGILTSEKVLEEF